MAAGMEMQGLKPRGGANRHLEHSDVRETIGSHVGSQPIDHRWSGLNGNNAASWSDLLSTHGCEYASISSDVDEDVSRIEAIKDLPESIVAGTEAANEYPALSAVVIQMAPKAHALDANLVGNAGHCAQRDLAQFAAQDAFSDCPGKSVH